MIGKILIVSLWGYNNFGNRLQSLALKWMVEKDKYSAVFSVADRKSFVVEIKKKIIRSLGIIGVERCRKAYLQQYRYKAIKSSCNKLNCQQTKMINNYDYRSFIDSKEYAAAIAGSDQVWHNWYRDMKMELPYFYLEFMPPEKRISYAASFGFEEFPEADKEQHYKGLQGMRFISCREESGCKLVEEATGKPGTLVLDPTLCVERSYWDSLEEKPRYIKERPYLLVYMLGKRDEYYEFIKKYAQLNELEIIDLHDTNRKDVWKTTIGGFIWLVHHAEMICTDSFHCTVFSILYQQPFQVFRRKQKGFEHMFDRIETLLKLAGLGDCEFDGKEIKKEDIDYNQVGKKINVEKEKSISWLRNALKEVAGNNSYEE